MTLQAVVRARALARTLTLGLASPSDVISWVDGVIVETEAPDSFLIDASLSERDVNSLISTLEQFLEHAGMADGPERWSAGIGELSALFKNHSEDGPRIASVLY